jgi:hypothetical protein
LSLLVYLYGVTMRVLRPSEIQQYPESRPLSPEELAEAYALAKAAFTAEDLQRYTEEDEGVSMEEVLQELDELQRQFDQRSP